MKNSKKLFEDRKINVKLKISALWISLMLLYIYADFFSLFTPGAIEEMINGNMGPFPATQMALFSATIMMTIPAVMVYLSVTLKSGINRWFNIIFGAIYTAISVANLIGETWVYYIFFGIVEIIITLIIIRLAWRWPPKESVI